MLIVKRNRRGRGCERKSPVFVFGYQTGILTAFLSSLLLILDMFVYNHPQSPRTRREKLFKWLYFSSLLFNGAAFIITICEFLSKMTATYDNFADRRQLTLHPSLLVVLEGCERRGQVVINGKVADSILSSETFEYAFLAMTALAFGIFISHGLLMATDFTTKMLFAYNIRNIRVRGVLLRMNWIQPFWLLLYTVFVIAFIAASSSSRQYVQDYVEYCVEQTLIVNRTQFVELEVTSDVIFATDFTLITIATSINLGIYCLASFHNLYYSLTAVSARLAQYEYPWERGIGRPNRFLLMQWCTQRKRLGETLLAGSTDNVEALEGEVFLPSLYLHSARPQPVEMIEQQDQPPEEYDDGVMAAFPSTEQAPRPQRRRRRRKSKNVE